MPDSAPSAIVTATSPAQMPAAPVINSVIFLDPTQLKATVNVTLSDTDAAGRPYSPLVFFSAVKIFVGPTGTLTPETVATVFPATDADTYIPGQQHEFEVDVPNWNTAYDFEAEVSL